MARSLLVTGAAGFIGANFVHYWLGQHPGDRVVAFDALTYAGNRENLATLEGHILDVRPEELKNSAEFIYENTPPPSDTRMRRDFPNELCVGPADWIDALVRRSHSEQRRLTGRD